MKQHPKPIYKIGSSRSEGSAKFIGHKVTSSRPASAREVFESNNHKRNEEAWKYEEMLANVNNMKKIEWQAKVYTALAHKKRDATHIDWKEEREKEKNLNERREKLRHLFTKEEKQYEKEREEKMKLIKNVPSHLSDPEIELLRSRLNELKRQNVEERKKLAERLSYEAWKKNNPDLRHIESERFNKFIRDSWIDQKQWREDERTAREEERMKCEQEAEERENLEKEEEKRSEARLHQERSKWKNLLEEQIRELKEHEKEEEVMRQKEVTLEKEKIRLQEITGKREKHLEERKRKHLELFWAKQCKLKLKQKTLAVQEELLNEEMILEDLLRDSEREMSDEENNEFHQEGEWMRNILDEQKKLEKLREKEYDLLFSEEAEKMWLKREAEWLREQRARDKLFEEVMTGLQNQLEEKLASTKRTMECRRAEREDLITDIEDSQKQIEGKEEKMKHPNMSEIPSAPSIQCPSDRDIRRQEMLMDRKIEERQKEIVRLEEEMRKIWLDSYIPPKFGRKKVDWQD